ncbi:MAG: hypothetical protein ACXABY_24155, partial [Candidatus Thorarchaeota archaeon]
MAILDDFAIDYTAKSIKHTSGATIYTVRALYSALQDEFDEPGQMDDQTPMSAQTPTEFTLTNQWYMDNVSTQFLDGGALKTEDWTRIEGTRAGIVQIFYTGTDPIASDIGDPITHSDGDAGILLDYDTAASPKSMTIRPDSSATADNWDSGAGTITFTSNTATQTGSTLTGETLWANVFTLGTLEDNTDLYIIQARQKLSAWWTTGQIDVLVRVAENSSNLSDASTLIGYGVLTVFARQYSKLYDNFSVDVSAGGRNAVPVGTGADLNNTSGYRTFTGSSGSGTFVVGEVIDEAVSLAKGVVTAVAGTTSDPILDYYLIGDVTIDINSSGAQTVTGADSGAQCQSAAPSAAGPDTGTTATITVTFGSISRDINNGAGAQPYDVEIDVQAVSLANMYERTKFLTRRGATGDIDDGTQSVVGEQ